MARKLISDLERFQRSIVKTEAGCWEWQKFLDRDGYGFFRTGSHKDGTRRQHRSHRWAYEHFVRPIPDGLQIDHLCRNRRCVNPEHLDPVTVLENARRGWRKNKPFCKSGHALTGRNLYICPSSGRRSCVICRRRWVKEHNLRTGNAALKRYQARNRELLRAKTAARRAAQTDEQRAQERARQREYDRTRRRPKSA